MNVGAASINRMKIDRLALMQQVARHQSLREFDKANAPMQLLLEHFPEHPDVNHLYAGLLSATREFALAIKHYRKALQTKPGDANCWNDLGAAYTAIDEVDDAIASFTSALQISPDLPGTLMNLGSLYHKQGNYQGAIDCISRVLRTHPDEPVAHLLLGNACKSAKRFDDAVGSYNQAVTLNPNYYQAFFNLALVLRDREQFTAALDNCDQALKVKPDYYGALMLSGQINEHLGNIATAREFYNRCIALSPESTEAYWNLANLGGAAFSQSTTETMQALLLKPISDESRVYLLFALAKALEEQKKYSPAFACLQQGNSLKRQLLGDDVVDAASLIKRLRTRFDPDVMAGLSNKGNLDVAPIFIVGMVRSGTSLIEQILAGHTDVASGGELETSLQLLFDELPALAGQDWETSVSQLDTSQLHRLANRYCELNQNLVGEKLFFTDKLPFNFALIGFLSLLFPKARFVHVYKHPLDSCLSCYKQLFTVGQEFSYNLDELADYYQEYLKIMRHWSSLLPDNIIHVSYASLVECPRDTIEHLLKFLSLPWQDSCLEFHKRSGVVKTASAGQVRQRLYTSSVGRWKHYQQDLLLLSDRLASAIAKFESEEGMWPDPGGRE